MKNRNEIGQIVFFLSMLINIATVAILIQFGITDANSEYLIKQLAESINSPVLKTLLILSGIISFSGIIISYFHFKYLGQLSRLDVIEMELHEEKEKYRIATEAFKDLQKSNKL